MQRARLRAPVYESDVRGLTHFAAPAGNIRSLAGLECAASLKILVLEGNRITDILPLANLTNMSRHDLEANQIECVSPLTDLTNPVLLRLSRNQIVDISPLLDNEGLSKGDRVELRENPRSADSLMYIWQLLGRGVIVD